MQACPRHVALRGAAPATPSPVGAAYHRTVARAGMKAKRRPSDEGRASRSSGRYTAPSRTHVRERPRFHRPLGWFLVAIGLIIAALNGLMFMGDDLTLLPGGFSLVYVVAGLPVAAFGGWFLGLFDEGQTLYR